MGLYRVGRAAAICAFLAGLVGACNRPARPGDDRALTAPRDVAADAALPLPAYRVRYLDGAGPLTARIDQPPWTGVPDLGRLTQVGTDGAPMRFDTRVKVGWTDKSIRIIWHCLDGEILAEHVERDSPVYTDDCVELFVSPTGDLTRYFEFVANARGAMFDSKIANPSLKRTGSFRIAEAWNCPGLRWHATRGPVGSDGERWWAVEMEIPFAGLGVEAPAVGDVWRANVCRIDHVDSEQWGSWSALPHRRYGLHQSDRFGLWIFER